MTYGHPPRGSPFGGRASPRMTYGPPGRGPPFGGRGSPARSLAGSSLPSPFASPARSPFGSLAGSPGGSPLPSPFASPAGSFAGSGIGSPPVSPPRLAPPQEFHHPIDDAYVEAQANIIQFPRPFMPRPGQARLALDQGLDDYAEEGEFAEDPFADELPGFGVGAAPPPPERPQMRPRPQRPIAMAQQFDDDDDDFGDDPFADD